MDQLFQDYLENQSVYVSLHNHTTWSLLDGMNRIDEMVQRAKELGMKAIAITDHGNLFGTIEFYKACIKADIKPILGCEVYVTGDRLLKERKELDTIVSEDRNWLAFRSQKRRKKPKRKKDDNAIDEYEIVNAWGNCHLVLLARTQEGYENLLHIVSDANLNGFYYKPLTDKSMLKEFGKGIIALSACLGGEIPQLIMKGDIEQAKNLAIEYRDIFDEFYLEVQPGSTPEQILVNETLIELSKELNIPLVCTSDSHYLRKEDGEIHDVLLAVQTGKKVDDPDRMRFPEMINWLKSEDEMRADGMPEEAIANTQHIADVCDVTIPLDRLLVPAIDVPLGYTPDTYLSKLCYDGLFELALTKPIDVNKYKERLKYELDIVQQKELSGYFLIVRDFIKWATDHGIMIGPGRGSAAGSLISNVIGITKLDPLEHGLLFERFLNPERKSYPDIDTDIGYTKRHEVIQYVTEKYGADCVCQIGTFGTMATRSVLKDVSRALDIPWDIVNEITKQIPVVYGVPYSLRECLYGSEKKGYQPVQAMVDAYKTYPQLFKVAMALEDNPRHSSAHASGVVISPTAVEKVFPLMTNKEDEATSQYDMSTLEELGVNL